MQHALPPRVASDDSSNDQAEKKRPSAAKSKAGNKKKPPKGLDQEDDDEPIPDDNHAPLSEDRDSDDHEQDDPQGSNDGIPSHLRPPNKPEKALKRPASAGAPKKRPAKHRKDDLGQASVDAARTNHPYWSLYVCSTVHL